MINNLTFQSRTSFGERLHQLRQEYGWSLRDVQEKSHLTYSIISSFEHGERPVGAMAAMKLAGAFSLGGDELDKFLFLAAATRRRDRLVTVARNMPPEILNSVALLLSKGRVELEQIEACDMLPAEYLGDGTITQKLIVKLIGGKQVTCDLSLTLGQ